MNRVCRGEISSPFGLRRDPIDHSMRMHQGVDIEASMGCAVYSPCNGTVASVYLHTVGGRTLIIRSEDGLQRFGFCHLSQCIALQGQIVERGQKIALTGNSGRTTGPHLHFSVRIGGRWLQDQYLGGEFVDPKDYMQWQ
ncbi:MAG: M23 family metallopeptidase [Mucinivorans sp.]